MYLRFKDEDGTVADSYYDIDFSTAGANFKKVSTLFNKNRKENISLTNKTDNGTLDVDFSSAIEPGTFCYEICVYDAQGNISAPQEVCATVQSWGGNTTLLGEWEATKTEFVNDFETDIKIIGEGECSDHEFSCSETDEIIDYVECNTINFANIIFNEDGSFVVNSQETFTDLDLGASINACEAIFLEDVHSYESLGFWAYDAENSRLTLVKYSSTQIVNGVTTNSETFEEGDGELVFDGILTITGNDMVINEQIDSDLDGVIDYDDKYFLTKK